MSIHHFVWTDLSTFDMVSARADYASLFGWTFAGDESYDFALAGSAPVAAIFPMPDKLVEINMPSFWMSYIRVADLDRSVARARTHPGVIIEIEPHDFYKDARIALVRDPSGAGFTLYEGPDITPHGFPAETGHVTERYHHLPDCQVIAYFYEDMFGWTFTPRVGSLWPSFEIRHSDGSLVAMAEEVPEQVRGKFRYWIPCFSVPSVEAVVRNLTRMGGAVSSDLEDGRFIVHDRQGASFMLRELG